MTESDDRDSAPRSLSASISSLLAALLGSVRTRAELASVEYAEERARVGQQLALLVAGLGCLLFAVFFVAFGVVAWYWDTHRFAAIIGVIVVFAGAGAVLVWRRSEVVRAAPTPFAASLAELEKDRAALARATNRRADP
jgi:uncharacterized membrane protein YqjE